LNGALSTGEIIIEDVIVVTATTATTTKGKERQKYDDGRNGMNLRIYLFSFQHHRLRLTLLHLRRLSLDGHP